MSNETKRDVFEKALREWDDLVHSCGLQGEEAHGGCEFDPILIKYKKDYDAALPDDLPVIPECVNYAIEWFKQNDDDLGEVFRNAYEDLVDDWHECPQLEVAETWIINRPDEFARAWVSGVWNVDGTGEIVKLEAEK